MEEYQSINDKASYPQRPSTLLLQQKTDINNVNSTEKASDNSFSRTATSPREQDRVTLPTCYQRKLNKTDAMEDQCINDADIAPVSCTWKERKRDTELAMKWLRQEVVSD